MATTTPNYGLTKPDLSELYDIGVQNTNMDLIDTQMKQNADDITALVNGLYYHKGDDINLYRAPKNGYITTGGTEIYITIPLAKPLDSNISGATVSGGTIIIRGANGYVGGSAGISLSDTTQISSIVFTGPWVANQDKEGIVMTIKFTSAPSGAANNTPVSCGFSNGSKLTLS